MYHVFIVNDTTFKYHLEYLFAGTCASRNPDFLEDSTCNNSKKSGDGITPKQELTICGMIADVSKIRSGDKVLFYLTQTKKHDGMFFGVFTAVNKAFFDSNHNNFLASKLNLKLNFRVQLRPDEVYAKGISEREALDSLVGITNPSQMCWSLIYRKLKGKRGCTMITDYEAKRLCDLIIAKNGRALTGDNFTYNSTLHLIETKSDGSCYTGDQHSIDIKDRMLVKDKRKKAYEAHLQAYILQHIDDQPLATILNINPSINVWIGNEVSCGVGMQSIDIMTQQIGSNDCTINIIELKDGYPYNDILINQLPKYIDWVKDYIAPLYQDKNIIINRIIIAKKMLKKKKLEDFIDNCNQQSESVINNIHIRPVKYVGYSIANNDISFEILN